ncbi:Gfo/Idh/MocA family oxidoreductase [Sphingosinicella sp. LHD-64]|uniref:Gfo/Idh/MocA family oxidoreductase n=1 Tax=Sphingosinicella sp. LHD-64 TaxID=3072139 RepID=UPI0028103913|nr:Gfo/Idh/MocA family oxidoreductase [Sphingosinicella sp. LHD-64]MDQ8757427.1 Gfo/Idh/MocA family oxidoreductase [Sphingosinicella sp. LHD-64]
MAAHQLAHRRVTFDTAQHVILLRSHGCNFRLPFSACSYLYIEVFFVSSAKSATGRIRTSELRLGIIGLGRGFMLTLPALAAHPAVRLAGAADPRAEALEAFGRDYGARTYGDHTALLADDAIDAVYIASPHQFHAEQAIAAARAGKHVLVEKPMATSHADCLAMAESAECAGVALIVGPSHGFDAPVHHAASIIASRTLGRVRMITALNYTDFLYRPRRPEELDGAKGGGVVYSQAAHQIDVVRRLAGTAVRSVRATIGQWDPARPCEGAYNALLNFEDGATATLTYGGYGRYDSDELMGWISELGRPKDPAAYGAARRALAAIADGGEAAAKLARAFGVGGAAGIPAPAPHHEHFGFVLVSCERGDLRLMPDGVWVYSDTGRRFEALPPPVIPREAVIGEFVAAVRGERPPIHDGHWGAATVACCEAIHRSSAERREILM